MKVLTTLDMRMTIGVVDMKKIVLLTSLVFAVVVGTLYFIPYSFAENEDNSASTETKNLGVDEDLNITANIPTGVKTLPYYKVIKEDRVHIKNASHIVAPRNSLPSEEEAVKIANSCITSNNYLPNDSYLNKVTTQFITSVNKSSEDTITEKKFPAFIEVEYCRAIDGYPVSGAGDSITVCIGEHNEVIYLFKTWRELERVGDVSIIDANSAIEKLKQYETVEKRVGSEELPAEINEIELGYYSEATGIEQAYYKPVWIFKGKDKSGDYLVRCVYAA